MIVKVAYKLEIRIEGEKNQFTKNITLKRERHFGFSSSPIALGKKKDAKKRRFQKESALLEWDSWSKEPPWDESESPAAWMWVSTHGMTKL